MSLIFTSILGEMIQFDWYSFDGLKPPTRGSLLRVLSPAIGGLCLKSRLIFSFWTSLLGTNISPTSWALLSDSQILLFRGGIGETPWRVIEEKFVPLFFGNHPNGDLKNPKHPPPQKKAALKLIRLRNPHISDLETWGVKSGDPWSFCQPWNGAPRKPYI